MKAWLAALAALFLAPAAFADVLVDNVNGYTLDREGKLVRFASMVVADDGRVRQLLPRGQKTTQRTQFRIDGRGRTLIPGLIDAHGHVMGLGFNALQLDLSELAQVNSWG